jgi:hypothetical protein
MAMAFFGEPQHDEAIQQHRHRAVRSTAWRVQPCGLSMPLDEQVHSIGNLPIRNMPKLASPNLRLEQHTM